MKTTSLLILFISIISFGLVARTGYLGGQIRHTEINGINNTNPTLNQEDTDND
jgi:hypothetical protein